MCFPPPEVTVLNRLIFRATNGSHVFTSFVGWEDKSSYFVMVRNSILSCSLRSQIGYLVCAGTLKSTLGCKFVPDESL